MKTEMHEVLINVDGKEKVSFTNKTDKDFNDPTPWHLSTCKHCHALFTGKKDRTICKKCQAYIDSQHARKP